MIEIVPKYRRKAYVTLKKLIPDTKAVNTAGNSKNKDAKKTIESVDIFALKQNQNPQKHITIINNCFHTTRGVEDVKKEISIWFG